MLFKTHTIIFTIAFSIFAGTALASTYTTVDISTGIDAGAPGNPIYPAGAQDKFWEVISSPSTPTVPVPYIPNLTTGTYVAYVTLPGTTYINTDQKDAGTYEYQRCFCVDNPEEAKMSLQLRADNQAEVFLNSYQNSILNVTTNDSFKHKIGSVETSKGIIKGKNCLRIKVNNEGNITGLDTKILVSGWGAKEVADRCCKKNKRLFGEKR